MPVRAISLGRILQRELDSRGWTQKDLAEITKRPPQTINEIIKGTKQITPETARELSAALGTTAEFWINLETNYRLKTFLHNGQISPLPYLKLSHQSQSGDGDGDMLVLWLGWLHLRRNSSQVLH